MQFAETKWRSGGSEQCVRTEINPGETPEAMVIRHKALVDAMQAPGKFPKDP